LGQIRLPAPEQRPALRALLTPLVDRLIQGLNGAFAKLREEVDNLVFILDNIEKVVESGDGRVDHLYQNRLGVLRNLDAHVVLTVPLSLASSPTWGGLTAVYNATPVVLPLVKVRARDGSDEPTGLALMTEVLTRRVDFELLFEGGSATAMGIARLSGGCIRHALRIVGSAVNMHDDPKVSRASVLRAAGQLQRDLLLALPEASLPVLRTVDEKQAFPETEQGKLKPMLLQNLFVLQYQNGDPTPWFAVHPLVRAHLRGERLA
jgi:hypothetical protein